jgi:hypothetical protein
VHLKILGSTNGDEVAVFNPHHEFQKIELDSKKNFNSDIVFYYFATVPGGEFEMSTIIMAFRDRWDTLSVHLNSGNLKY